MPSRIKKSSWDYSERDPSGHRERGAAHAHSWPGGAMLGSSGGLLVFWWLGLGSAHHDCRPGMLAKPGVLT